MVRKMVSFWFRISRLVSNTVKSLLGKIRNNMCQAELKAIINSTSFGWYDIHLHWPAGILFSYMRVGFKNCYNWVQPRLNNYRIFGRNLTEWIGQSWRTSSALPGLAKWCQVFHYNVISLENTVNTSSHTPSLSEKLLPWRLQNIRKGIKQSELQGIIEFDLIWGAPVSLPKVRNDF